MYSLIFLINVLKITIQKLHIQLYILDDQKNRHDEIAFNFDLSIVSSQSFSNTTVSFTASVLSIRGIEI